MRDIKGRGKKKSYEDGIYFSWRENGRKTGGEGRLYCCDLVCFVLMPCKRRSFHSWKLTNKKNLLLDNILLHSCIALIGLCLLKVMLPLMECVALVGCVVLLFTVCSGHGTLMAASSFVSLFSVWCTYSHKDIKNLRICILYLSKSTNITL